MAVLNSTIIERAWLSGSNDFQQRIPNPSINAYANVVNSLFAPLNNDLFNEFCGLLNGLNATYVDQRRFENPLRSLKKPATSWGNSERHVAVKYLKAHAGRFDDETLLKVEQPEFVEWFYSVGEPRRYEFSWSRQEIARAFAEDGYGYDDLLSATINQMLSSADYDEMNIMIQMFAEADKRMGLYRYNLSAAPTTKALAEEMLIGVRAVAGRMQFPTTHYNHIPVPVHESPETLLLWVTPEVDSVIDLAYLANVFQLDIAQIKYRKILIPEFPIPNVYAALTSEDFIYYRDFMTGLEPPFYNPGNRTMKYYYWQNGLTGINPAANCVLFTTDAGTNISTITMTPSAFAFSPDSATVYPGDEIQLHYSLTGSVTNDSEGLIGVEPDSATFTIAAVDSLSAAKPLKATTYVDNNGVFHIQKTGLSTGDVITVTAVASYINPSGSTNTYTDDFVATVG